MLLVTLVSVTLGSFMGRLNYLHGKAEFHEEKYAEALERLTVLTRHRVYGFRKLVDLIPSFFSDDQEEDDQGEKAFVLIVAGNNDLGDVSKREFIAWWNEACQQHRLADAYRQGASRPWAPVKMPKAKPEE